MKRKLAHIGMGVSLFVIVLVVNGTAEAFDTAARPAGAGIVVGEPTGISAKVWLTPAQAVQGAVSYSVRREFFQIHVDYVWHYYDLLAGRKRREAGPASESMGYFPLYVDAGGRLSMKDTDLEVGARVPVGLAYLFHKAPVDLFLEIVPGISLAPATEFELQGGLGVRYYF